MEKIDSVDEKFKESFPSLSNDDKSIKTNQKESIIYNGKQNLLNEKLKSVKNDLWMGAGKGGFAGISIGYLSFLVFKNMNKKYNHPNCLVLSVLVNGCLGMYLGSVVNGKNSLQFVSDIFIENSNPSSSYLSTLNNNNKLILDKQNESYIRRNKQINENKLNKPINKS
jgi:hypothetical protein